MKRSGDPRPGGGYRIVSLRRHIQVLGAEEAVSVIESYERRHRVIAPIIRAVLSWLVGWGYTGSEEDRREVVAQLPFIAFRPAA